jgi:hypothetical protein
VDLIIISLRINLFSPWYSWKNNNNSFTHYIWMMRFKWQRLLILQNFFFLKIKIFLIVQLYTRFDILHTLKALAWLHHLTKMWGCNHIVSLALLLCFIEVQYAIKVSGHVYMWIKNIWFPQKYYSYWDWTQVMITCICVLWVSTLPFLRFPIVLCNCSDSVVF